MNSTSENHIVTSKLIPEHLRLSTLPRYFDEDYLRAESLVYYWMHRLSKTYDGGYWHFYVLSNGGFYMAPAIDSPLEVVVESNGFAATMSADAAGLVAVLYAFCQLANDLNSHRFNELYFQVREFAMCHAEAELIWRAID